MLMQIRAILNVALLAGLLALFTGCDSPEETETTTNSTTGETTTTTEVADTIPETPMTEEVQTTTTVKFHNMTSYGVSVTPTLPNVPPALQQAIKQIQPSSIGTLEYVISYTVPTGGAHDALEFKADVKVTVSDRRARPLTLNLTVFEDETNEYYIYYNPMTRKIEVLTTPAGSS